MSKILSPFSGGVSGEGDLLFIIQKMFKFINYFSGRMIIIQINIIFFLLTSDILPI